MSLVLLSLASLLLGIVIVRGLASGASDPLERSFAFAAPLPVLLTIVVPVVTLVAREYHPSPWVDDVTRGGVVLSALLLTLGAGLIVRARRARRRTGAVLVAASALAGAPAIVTALAWVALWAL